MDPMNLNVYLTCILLERQSIGFAIEKLVTTVYALTIFFPHVKPSYF